MHFLQPAVIALFSVTSLVAAQGNYFHPRDLQVRAYEDGFQAGLAARWAEPEAYAEAEADPWAEADAYAEAEPSREDHIAEGTAICRKQLVS